MDDQGVVKIHSLYVRHILPMTCEVQYWEFPENPKPYVPASAAGSPAVAPHRYGAGMTSTSLKQRRPNAFPRPSCPGNAAPGAQRVDEGSARLFASIGCMAIATTSGGSRSPVAASTAQ